MLNFIVIMLAVYIALVAAALTILMVCASKWYIKKANKIAMRTIESFCDED